MIFLRPININDTQRLFEIRSNKFTLNQKFNNFNTNLVTIKKTNEWINNFINEIDAIRIGINLLKKNYLIGSITIGKINYKKLECEINIYIDTKFQGKGYGKKSMYLLINYIKNILKLKNIFLDVHKDNIKALNLYKKIGFIIDNEKSKINEEFIKMIKKI